MVYMKKAVLYRLGGLLQAILMLVCMQASGQVNSMRLIGQSNYDRNSAGYILTDTTGYRYTGKHTSNMKTGLHKYDTSVYFVDTGKGKEPGRQYLRTFDAADRIASHTMQEFVAGAWRNNTRFSYVYTGTGTYDSVLTEQWDTTNKVWKRQRLQQHKYKAGNIDTIFWWMPDGGSGWKKEGRDVYTYNLGALMHHELQIWNDTLTKWDVWELSYYGYDASNRMISHERSYIDLTTLMTELRSKDEYAWDGSGRMSMHETYSWFKLAMRWDGMYQHYYNYNVHNDVNLETVNKWDATVSMWGPHMRRQHNYDAAFNLLNIVEKAFVFPGYEDARKEEWLYNIYNLPTAYRSFLWSGAAWQQEQGSRTQVLYYYEEYDSTLSVKEQLQQANTTELYPNPAKDMVTLQMNWQNTAPVHIMLYDMQGRLLRDMQVADARHYKQAIPLTGMAQGMYILRATDGNKEMTKRLIIDSQ